MPAAPARPWRPYADFPRPTPQQRLHRRLLGGIADRHPYLPVRPVERHHGAQRKGLLLHHPHVWPVRRHLAAEVKRHFLATANKSTHVISAPSQRQQT